METLQDLVSTGRLAVEEKQNVALDARSTLSLLRVELAPGVTEPAHTHPGVELIYGRLPAVQNAILDSAAELDVGYRGSSLSAESRTVTSTRPARSPARSTTCGSPAARTPATGPPTPPAGTRRPAGRRVCSTCSAAPTSRCCCSTAARPPPPGPRMAAAARQVRAVLGDDVRTHVVVPADRASTELSGLDVLLEPDGDAHRRYGAAAESLYLVRPDGYIAFRSQPAHAEPVIGHLRTVFSVPAPAR